MPVCCWSIILPSNFASGFRSTLEWLSANSSFCSWIASFNESKEFLDNNNSDYLNDINPSIEEYFEFFKVSKFVNNPINNSYECFKPIN